MEKHDTIKPLFDLPDASELLSQFQRLVLQKKYTEAISFGKRKFKNGAPPYTYYIGMALCYSEMNKHIEAVKILSKAATLFPDNADVYYYLGTNHFVLENYEETEECFLKSLELTPSEKRIERSECLNNLGVLYWNDLRREEALDCWKDAVKENPFNSKAQENIKEFSNEYGEPKAANRLFDELNHFQIIHRKKYFELKAKNEFDSIEEIEEWTEITTRKWNEIMEAKIHDISSMSSVQKTDLYSNVAIDYSMMEKKINREQPKKKSEKSPANKSKLFRKGFSFIDEDMLIFLPLTVPILSLSGLEKERFEAIANGAKATEEEEELFFWAFDFLESVLESATNIPANKKKQLLIEAKHIALEVLDEVDAEDAIKMTKDLCCDFLGDLTSLRMNNRNR